MHVMCASRQWKEVHMRCISHPRELVIKNEHAEGKLPVIYALQQGAPLEIIQWMVNTNYNIDVKHAEDEVDMLTMVSKSLSIVLHHAALYSDVETINYLVKQNPKTLSMVNLDGKFPKDLAKEKKRDQKIINALTLPFWQKMNAYINGDL